MQNNSNNNNQGWRQRIDEFEDVAGNNLDLNASWGRLQEKKNSRQSYSPKKWYWLAAACIIALLVALATLLQKNSVQPLKPELVQSNDAEKSFEKNITIQHVPETIKIIHSTSPTPDIPAAGDFPVIKKKTSSEPLLVVQPVEIKEPPQLMQPVDTIIKEVSPTTAVAKKLKVVHINELHPYPAGDDITQQESKPYFPVNQKSRREYSNNAGNTAGGKDNLVKFRLN